MNIIDEVPFDELVLLINSLSDEASFSCALCIKSPYRCFSLNSAFVCGINVLIFLYPPNILYNLI